MTAVIPQLETSRLQLGPFAEQDAPWVEQYAGDFEVARRTETIPHPYPPGSAVPWIAGHAASYAAGQTVVFAIRLLQGDPVGTITLRLNAAHRRGELGYWIGRPFWNQGYASEAAAAVVRYGFEVWNLEKIEAHHLASNLASGRVMTKIRMAQEGVRRSHYLKEGVRVDRIDYGLERADAA